MLHMMVIADDRSPQHANNDSASLETGLYYHVVDGKCSQFHQPFFLVDGSSEVVLFLFFFFFGGGWL